MMALICLAEKVIRNKRQMAHFPTDMQFVPQPVLYASGVHVDTVIDNDVHTPRSQEKLMCRIEDLNRIKFRPIFTISIAKTVSTCCPAKSHVEKVTSSKLHCEMSIPVELCHQLLCYSERSAMTCRRWRRGFQKSGSSRMTCLPSATGRHEGQVTKVTCANNTYGTVYYCTITSEGLRSVSWTFSALQSSQRFALDLLSFCAFQSLHEGETSFRPPLPQQPSA